MATPQLSPGVLVREVDLTVGRADNVLDNIGAIAGPFSLGPVDESVNITTEQELIDVFGKPSSSDGQYEYWMSASSFLSYGGVLKVVRTSGDNLVNANAKRTRTGEIQQVDGVGIASTTRTPATYTLTGSDYSTSGNGADANFTITVADNGSGLGSTVTVLVTNGGVGFVDNEVITVDGTKLGGNGSTDDLTFSVNGIYTLSGVSTVGQSDLLIKNFDDYNQNYADDIASYIFAAKTAGSWANNLKVCFIDDKADQIVTAGASFLQGIGTCVGLGVSIPLTNEVIAGFGTTSTFTGTLKGIITGQSEDSIDVKIISRVAAGSSTETLITYNEKDGAASISDGQTISIMSAAGVALGSTTLASADAVEDWYDQQTLGLTNSSIYWKSIAPKPTSNVFVTDRNGRNDAIHVAIVDDTGEVTGIQGNLLEKHLFLSKAIDAVSAVNSPQRIWWKEYLAQYSKYVYVGDNPSDASNNEEIFQTFFEDEIWNVDDGPANGLWNQDCQDVSYSVLGNATYNLSGGKNYGTTVGATGDLKAELGDLITSYQLFANKEEIEVDYLIMGPGLENKYQSQAKANYLISIANDRKDCMAVISPHRYDVVSEPDPSAPNVRRYLTAEQITNNIIEFYSPLSSSSYTVFDTGYKYTFDRFNNKFRYIPTNADVAGLMVRTSIFAYPWFSPAGEQRGVINNAIKLAYNPNKAQRDRLYPKRINSIINKPGSGILLFGDKTALGYASAFDRINVRRLFLTVEQALSRASEGVLFELNDEITRANFLNIVEPYLRDVKAKRGLYGYLVVCDESNNTPDVIDNNEFRADIFLKPAKSINFITLTFVATRTGVSFEEVAGTV